MVKNEEKTKTGKELNAKMERCVKDVMSQGYDKIVAIKICKKSILSKYAKNKSRK